MKPYIKKGIAAGVGTIALASVPYIADAQTQEYIPLRASYIPAGVNMSVESDASLPMNYPNPGLLQSNSRITGMCGKRRFKGIGSVGFYLDDNLGMEPDWRVGGAYRTDEGDAAASVKVTAGGRGGLAPNNVRIYGDAVIKKMMFDGSIGWMKNPDGSWSRDMFLGAGYKDQDKRVYAATARLFSDDNGNTRVALGPRVQFTNIFPQDDVLELGLTTTFGGNRDYEKATRRKADMQFNVAYKHNFNTRSIRDAFAGWRR
jgi:hypothetical protein